MTTRRLSLLLVLLVLVFVFVYPMKMVFSAMFNGLSGGYLPANFTIGSTAEVFVLFVTFGVAFGSLGLTMFLLYLHAWRQRNALALDLGERLLARARMVCWALIPLVATVSILSALLLSGRTQNTWWVGFPGYIYFSLNIATPLIMRRARRKALKP